MTASPFARLAAALLLTVPGNLTASQSPTVDRVLRLAGQAVERYAATAAELLADEVGTERAYQTQMANAVSRETRWVAEFALILTPGLEEDGYPWVEFRDVVSVNGRMLADRKGRLERLFRDRRDWTLEKAAAITREAASVNVGPVRRNLNTPAVGLLMLHPKNQSRFRFAADGWEAIGRTRALRVRYQEQHRPTLIRSSDAADAPASGTLWIDPATGHVLRSTVNCGARPRWWTETTITYEFSERFGISVPARIVERTYASNGREWSSGEIAYVDFRRFETAGRLLTPAPEPPGAAAAEPAVPPRPLPRGLEAPSPLPTEAPAGAAARDDGVSSRDPGWPLPPPEAVRTAFSRIDRPAPRDAFVNLQAGYRWQRSAEPTPGGCTAVAVPWVLLELDTAHVNDTTAHRHEWQEGAEATVTLRGERRDAVATTRTVIGPWQPQAVLLLAEPGAPPPGRYLVELSLLVRATRLPMAASPVPIAVPACVTAESGPVVGVAVVSRAPAGDRKQDAFRPIATATVVPGDVVRADVSYAGRHDSVRTRVLRSSNGDVTVVPLAPVPRQTGPDAVTVELETEGLSAGDYAIEVAVVATSRAGAPAAIEASLIPFRVTR